MTSTAAVTTATLTVPDGSLYYEVRGSGPLMVLLGAPMGAEDFVGLAGEYTVLTTDPRGHRRSVSNDPEQESTPELRADDAARLIRAIDAGPAVVFGSSGGAVTTLALLESAPELVTAAIAHEPPLVELVDDRDTLHAQTEEQIALFVSGDRVGAWRKFMADAQIHMPEEIFLQYFGAEPPAEQAASENFWFRHEIRGTTHFTPNIDALRGAGAHLIIGIGEQSTGQTCDRTSRALGDALGIAPALFPGDHTGFVPDPVGFAARMRELLNS
ncbi:alpha/beta hydrolase [Nocardia uniformis]|uniref:Alpha/beta hydrolase n=1 Tax=Nocardia uniformis TaxID=53432 RepID=A0A849BX91_9NOCA|nr:alpha/beta hydrolase [Nocardia uniformis]NNH68910.1 alpha/beta hydrolase [Nocardia uniformis]